MGLNGGIFLTSPRVGELRGVHWDMGELYSFY